MEKNKIGEMILQHYEKYLGNFSDVRTYAGNEKTFPIQLLKYNNVFEGCKVFASLGVSKFSSIIRNNCEVVLAVDKDEDKAANILANVLFYIFDHGIELRRGTYVEGIKNVDSNFSLVHKKAAIYFTETYYFPEEFSNIDKIHKMYLAFFITETELEYLKKNGCDQFEDYLEDKDCDVFELNRN